MRWLLHGRSSTRPVKGGETFQQRCPECQEHATFYEVEVKTAAGAFFVDVLSSTDRAYACSACGQTFDVKDDPRAAAPAPSPERPARDLLAELERDRDKRALAQAERDRRVDDELAALKRKLGK